ncbi:MAG: hypothetical protein JWO90_2034, partial [Solirubrobacterales bacterium]|nr:hypothetical protein [Solirubrobacterales bacterium]
MALPEVRAPVVAMRVAVLGVH